MTTNPPSADEYIPFGGAYANPLPDSPSTRLRPTRRFRLPLMLFLATCLSVFWAGSTHWLPTYYMIGSSSPLSIRHALLTQWSNGLIYMACMLGILFTHEMGHFLVALRYRIPASLPFFLPLPISSVGTMGAVIAMDGVRANRKEIFDIGIAGPIAGLVVAIPILMVGISRLDMQMHGGLFELQLPLLLKAIFHFKAPPGYSPGAGVWQWQLNPYFMAGWVGLLITGLNMLPVSQLDGGHVLYTVFGRKLAHRIARGLMVLAIAAVVAFDLYSWLPMLLIVLMIGIDHPPTRDDSVELGWFRIVLGCISLAIPLLCFPPRVFM